MTMHEDDNKLLIRIDERTQNLMKNVGELSELITGEYVTKQEFGPVKSIVFGMVGFVLIGCLGALTALVLKK